MGGCGRKDSSRRESSTAPRYLNVRINVTSRVAINKRPAVNFRRFCTSPAVNTYTGWLAARKKHVRVAFVTFYLNETRRVKTRRGPISLRTRRRRRIVDEPRTPVKRRLVNVVVRVSTRTRIAAVFSVGSDFYSYSSVAAYVSGSSDVRGRTLVRYSKTLRPEVPERRDVCPRNGGSCNLADRSDFVDVRSDVIGRSIIASVPVRRMIGISSVFGRKTKPSHFVPVAVFHVRNRAAIGRTFYGFPKSAVPPNELRDVRRRIR